jgi:hypothetical protein
MGAWPVDPETPGSLFVLCKNHSSSGSSTGRGGDDADNRFWLQPASLRPLCRRCFVANNRNSDPVLSGSLDAPSDALAAASACCVRNWDRLRTVGRLAQALNAAKFLKNASADDALEASAGTIPIECFNDASHTTGFVSLKCMGANVSEGSERCQASSHEGGCVPLLQLVRKPVDFDDDDFFGGTDEDCVFRFDPCGHYLSVESLLHHWETVATRGGAGRGLVFRSSVEGSVVPACPMGEVACASSVLHDIHHYGFLPREQYERVKDFGRDLDPEFLAYEEEQSRARRAAEEEAEQDNDPTIARYQEIVRRVQAALDSVPSARPTCGVAGQKDGACTHVNCQNPHCSDHRELYCFFCGKLFRDLPHGGRRHDRNFLTRQDRCAWFLNAHPAVHRHGATGDGDTQRFMLLKALRLLRDVFDEYGRGDFAAAVEPSGALENVFPLTNDDNEEVLPPIDISIEDIAGYTEEFGNTQFRMP